MLFWIKNAVFLIILLALAYFLVANEEALFSDKSEAPTEVTTQTGETKAKPAKKKKANSAAEGLSRFYANLHGSDDGDGPKIRNNIVYLSEPKGDLVEKLKEEYDGLIIADFHDTDQIKVVHDAAQVVKKLRAEKNKDIKAVKSLVSQFQKDFKKKQKMKFQNRQRELEKSNDEQAIEEAIKGAIEELTEEDIEKLNKEFKKILED